MSDKPVDQPAVDTRPAGYDVEIGGVKHRITPASKGEHGAQVVLDGLARTAARGGAAGDIHGNTVLRDAAIAAGQAGDGTTPDGSTPDGRLPPDVVTQHEPYGEPGVGEGKPGFRPGDEAIQQAQADAVQKRQDAVAAAAQQVQQAAQEATPASAPPPPAPAPAASAPPPPAPTA